jgi:hypothetical protein
MITENHTIHGSAAHVIGRTMELGKFSIYPMKFDLISSLFIGAYGPKLRDRMDAIFPDQRQLYTRMFVAVKSDAAMQNSIAGWTQKAITDRRWQARDEKFESAPDAVHEQLLILSWAARDRHDRELADKVYEMLCATKVTGDAQEEREKLLYKEYVAGEITYEQFVAEMEREPNDRVCGVKTHGGKVFVTEDGETWREEPDGYREYIDWNLIYRERLWAAFAGSRDVPDPWGVKALHFLLTGRNIT